MEFIDSLNYREIALSVNKREFESLPVLNPNKGYDFRDLISNKMNICLPEILSPVMYIHSIIPKSTRTLTFKFWSSPREVAKMMVGNLISSSFKYDIYYTQMSAEYSREFGDIEKIVGGVKSKTILKYFLEGLEDIQVQVLDTFEILLYLNKGNFKSIVDIIEDSIIKALPDNYSLDNFSVDLDGDNLDDIFNNYDLLIKYMCKEIILTENHPNMRFSVSGSTVDAKMSRLFDCKYIDLEVKEIIDCFLVTNINDIIRSIKRKALAFDYININDIGNLIEYADINQSYADYIKYIITTEILKVAIRHNEEFRSELIKSSLKEL